MLISAQNNSNKHFHVDDQNLFPQRQTSQSFFPTSASINNNPNSIGLMDMSHSEFMTTKNEAARENNN